MIRINDNKIVNKTFGNKINSIETHSLLFERLNANTLSNSYDKSKCRTLSDESLYAKMNAVSVFV